MERGLPGASGGGGVGDGGYAVGEWGRRGREGERWLMCGWSRGLESRRDRQRREGGWIPRGSRRSGRRILGSI